MEAIILISFSIVIGMAIIGVVALTIDLYRVESHKDKHLPLH